MLANERSDLSCPLSCVCSIKLARHRHGFIISTVTKLYDSSAVCTNGAHIIMHTDC